MFSIRDNNMTKICYGTFRIVVSENFVASVNRPSFLSKLINCLRSLRHRQRTNYLAFGYTERQFVSLSQKVNLDEIKLLDREEASRCRQCYHACSVAGRGK